MAVVVMKVPISGPLAEWAVRFVGHLAAAGYAQTSIALRVRLFAHLSRWCDAERLLPARLDAAAIDRFLLARAASHVDLSSPATLAPVIAFLRSIGAVPPAPEAEDVAVGAVDALLDRWAAFLLSERAFNGQVLVHQLTALTELERIMLDSGQFAAGELAAAAAEAQGLGLFVRSLVGMDRAAATDALSAFTGGTTLTGNQLVFVNLIVDQLSQRGTVDPALLYEAPFTGVAPTGPESLFSGAQITELVATLRRLRLTVAPACVESDENIA